MILPTKGITPEQALMSLGADILRLMDETKTVSRLWHEFKNQKTRRADVSFDWFVLSLDLLFILGAVEFDRGRVSRSEKNAPETRS